jgi:hypothetical protein
MAKITRFQAFFINIKAIFTQKHRKILDLLLFHFPILAILFDKIKYLLN